MIVHEKAALHRDFRDINIFTAEAAEKEPMVDEEQQ